MDQFECPRIIYIPLSVMHFCGSLYPFAFVDYRKGEIPANMARVALLSLFSARVAPYFKIFLFSIGIFLFL